MEKEEEKAGRFALFWEKLSRLRTYFTEGENKLRWILALGLLGMLLILLSECVPGPNKEEAAAPSQESATLDEENSIYVSQMEARLKDLVESIDGAGSCKVMLTLRQGSRYIYATENKTTEDHSSDTSQGEGQKIQKKGDSDQKIVLLDCTDGSRKALIETRIEPEISGVAIVCGGGRSAVIREQITAAVVTVLGIRSTQIAVCAA